VIQYYKFAIAIYASKVVFILSPVGLPKKTMHVLMSLVICIIDQKTLEVLLLLPKSTSAGEKKMNLRITPFLYKKPACNGLKAITQ
jgi:hypothetical protein